MSNQNGSCYTSNTTRNRCDGIYNRLCLLKINISAEFTFCIYVDSNVDYGLTCA